MPTPSKLEAALQIGRQMDLLRLVAEQIVGGGHRHEHEADGEQHLIERARAIEAAIERALQHDADQRGDEEGERQRREERHAGAVHQQRRDIAAEHGEGAVREVDEVHQPQRHGEAAAQHEQQHAVGDAVEQDGQHERVVARGSSPLRARAGVRRVGTSAASYRLRPPASPRPRRESRDQPLRLLLRRP